MRRFSTYSYAFDNPVRFVDPDGMMPEEFLGSAGPANQQNAQTDPEPTTKTKPSDPISIALGFLYKLFNDPEFAMSLIPRPMNSVGTDENAEQGYYDELEKRDYQSLNDKEKVELERLRQKYSDAAKTVSSIAKNAKKMSPDDIGEFLGAGKDWHKTSAKTKFLNQFKKELKGDTNADFYIDKTTKEVYLKSNKSNNWINTGQKFE